MTERAVDLNCDLGESFGAYTLGQDEEILPWITSASIACGFHAGDPVVMERTVRLAAEHSVAIGAHPGFPDLVGFGRRPMEVAPNDIRADVIYQIGALSGFTRGAGRALQHVKPHGALNTMAVVDRVIAAAIVAGSIAFDRSLILISSGGHLTEETSAAGMAVAREAYADREYLADGTLMPRSQEGAVIHDVELIVERAVGMVHEQAVRAVSGEILPMRIDTLCVHGDTPNASVIVRALREGLEAAGIRVQPLTLTLGAP